MLFNILICILDLVTASAKECGIVKFIEPQILGGSQISRGEWPFVAALYYADDAKFFCGGTLISNKHVLTAAHCVQQKSSALRLTAEDLVVRLGVYNIDSKVERGVQQKDVAEIFVHPDWKVYHERYDADIAIFVLSDNVVFTKYIRAVCIPGDDDVFQDAKGSIVGWGLAENTTRNRHESIPRHAFTTALNDSYCFTTDYFLAIFSSPRTFCGGGEGGSPNKGDSGGGFFVYYGSVWKQFGIISASIGDVSGVVLPNSFSVYTNVKSFKNWIENIVQSSEDESTEQLLSVTASADKDTTIENIVRVSEVETTEQSASVAPSVAKEKITLKCDYEILSFYTCTVTESNATVENLEVKSLTGTHRSGKTDQNIIQIWFWQGTVAYIPEGIGLVFKHLEKFLVGFHDRNLGLKMIKRSNFKNMKSLTLIQLHESYIETVDVDTLWDIPNLDAFMLINSQLKVLPEKLFEKNPRLRHVNATANQIEYLPKDLFKHNPLIAEVNFDNNRLRSIYLNFNELKAIRIIELLKNSCIDKTLDDFPNLSELQQFVRNHC